MAVAVPNQACRVDVWLADPERVATEASAPAVLGRLSREERDRIDAAGGDRARRERLTTYLLARWALARRCGRGLEDLVLSRDDDGRATLVSPPAADVSFSLAHTRDLVVCGVAHQEAGVGVDVERRRPRPDAAIIARRFFCADEARDLERTPDRLRSDRFWALWTLKEALVKAAQLDLFDGLGACAFRTRGRGRVIHAFPSPRQAPPGRWQFALRAPSRAHFVAVAARSERARPLSLRLRDVTRELIDASKSRGSL
jgi:4'-phosphopantetheinyl transferase